MGDRLGFEEFARARAGQLFRIAYLLCGDWHEAQDLVQTSLAKMYVSWKRIERAESVDAYARQVLTRTFISHRRLKRSGETPSDEVEQRIDRMAPQTDLDLRLALMTAVRQLPPRNRAVVVLRYLEDNSIETVAQLMGTTPAAVKSLNTRALAQLRELLGADRMALMEL